MPQEIPVQGHNPRGSTSARHGDLFPDPGTGVPVRSAHHLKLDKTLLEQRQQLLEQQGVHFRLGMDAVETLHGDTTRANRRGQECAMKKLAVISGLLFSHDLQAQHLPTPEVCGGCHSTQHAQFEDEKRFGFPSHALVMERALDARHFVDKPKAEVTACKNCHSVATKCDSCHTRHRFSAAEARRPEACISCHSGPPHPDDESYFASAHGQL